MSKIASAPCSGPVASLHVGAPPPPSSSVKITRFPSLVNVAECQNAKFGSDTELITYGFSGSEMSIRAPSPMHAPAARSFSGKTVMSWQPWVRDLAQPAGQRTGSLTTDAEAGSSSGTFTTEILSCGGWQFGNAALGL